MAKKPKIEYVEVEGIKCEVKNPQKKGITKAYQESLRYAINDYVESIDRWSESKRNYKDNLEINVIVAPFLLGWLKKPEDEDEYRVIKGYMTHDELKTKRAKEAKKNAPKKRAPKKTAPAKKAPLVTNGKVKKPIIAKTVKKTVVKKVPLVTNGKKTATKKAAPKAAPKSPKKKK